MQLISVADGRIVAELERSGEISLPDARKVTMVDFSQIKTPGWYQLETGSGQSVPFQIGDDAYLPINERLVHALYLQRSGMAVQDISSGMNRPESHMLDGQMFRADEFHKAGTQLDVVGGWYDAGDFGKYVATTTITVARLLEAYRQTPQLYSQTKLPGSNKPAIIGESIYALDWLLKMQREDGAVYRKVSGARWPAKIGPWQDNQTRFIYGASTPEPAKFAASMALAARANIPLDMMYDVVTNAAGNSWMFENRMKHVVDGDFTPTSMVDIFVKDLNLVSDTAKGLKFPLPLASTALNMFTSASNAGYGQEDDSAVIKIFDGIELPKKEQ